ncbi:MAG TPA: macrolide ABC transporter ATP-binding protein [Micromonosporaceae bacterium]|nr:macrolide ABC transporter ATP-binding protein [Micromonosporaceae bacterium]HCU50311.1 macrolide ABC transporter ATP-binding protein [Micromonosporaceae bacterium]
MTVIELRGAGLTYAGPPQVAALLPCELRVMCGEYVTITGPSGSGKSTLLNILGLLDRPTEGAYLLDGVDTAPLLERARTAIRAHKIGFVFQSFHLLPHRTALENVMLSQLYRGIPSKARRTRARVALERVGLEHRMDTQPTTLSGGERQRVAIARALAGEPSLLLCDEPTGNLDTATADTVLDLIGDLNNDGMTVLMITHDERVAARANRTVSILDGVLTQ